MTSDVIQHGYSQRASSALLLLAKAIQVGDDPYSAKVLKCASDLIDRMPASEQKEDVSAIYCAVMFALGNGFHGPVARVEGA